MKNRFYYLLLACFFIMGNTTFAHQNTFAGGIELPIHGKTYNNTITVPEEYMKIDGSLLLPIEIELTNQYTALVFTQNEGNCIVLPSHLSGTYYIRITIGDFFVIKKIHL